MSVESEIRAIWSTSSTLTTLLPLKRFTTGTNVQDTCPFGVIRQGETTYELLTNDGPRLRKISVELMFKAESRTLLDQLAEAWDTKLLSASANTRKFRTTARQIRCQQNGVWELILQLEWRG